MTGFKKLATALHRSPEEPAESLGSWVVRFKYTLYGVMFACTVVIFLIMFSDEVERWKTGSPDVPIARSSWSVAMDNPSVTCPTSGQVTPGCLAHPENPTLWTSEDGLSTKLTDEQYEAVRDRVFWIGTTVSREQLEKVAELRANHLILGWISGDYRIWVNGDFLAEGSQEDREPIVLDLPLSYLLKRDTLKIAVRVNPEPGVILPAVLARPMEEGFAIRSHASAFKSLSSFWKKSRPFSLFLVNLLFSGFFFFLWIAELRKREYFYISVYALVCAAFQFRMTDLFSTSVSAPLMYSLDTVLRVSEGAFGMFLGFAFARSRQGIFRFGLPLAVLIPMVVSFGFPNPRAQYQFNAILDRWLVPGLYLVGAAVCAIQAFYLLGPRHKGSISPNRIRHLTLFAFGLTAIAVINGLQSHEMISFIQRALLSRFAHFGLVLLLGAVALLEFQKQKQLIDKTPISPYHRRPVLPERLTGAVLVVDLRNSERLFELGGLTGDSGRFVETCLTHLWGAAIDNGGVILQTEGDLLRAFFDESNCDSPVLCALLAAQDMERRLSTLRDQFIAQQLANGEELQIDFRGGIALGQIRPVWQEMGATRMASWIEAGDTHPFVDSARLMELERELPDSEPRPLVLIQDELVSTTMANILYGRWPFRAREIQGKHGRTFKVAGYCPRVAPGMTAKSGASETTVIAPQAEASSESEKPESQKAA